MPEPIQIRRALISVWDKTGIVEFARALHGEFGIEIISTGGTAKALRDAGIPVTLVETLTGCGEMLDGRVKTLHPAIHAAILADRDNPEHMRQLEAAGIKPIDMVVVNLYPFEKTVADPNCTFEQAIEMIDIGGVALLRAAAKNHKHVLAVPSAMWNEQVIDALRGKHPFDLPAFSRELANFTFVTTRRYDQRIWDYMISGAGGRGPFDLKLETFGSSYFLAMFRDRLLRYGENPHQPAAVYTGVRGDKQWLDQETNVRNATEMSYNNYLDADAALALCAEIARARHVVASQARYACAFIKHTNPCGVGVGDDPDEAYRRAYLGDPNAAMGGILALSFPVDASFAATVMETFDRFGKPLREAGAANAPGGFFVEVWIAPSFTDDAVAVIRGTAPGGPKKKWAESVRLLDVGDMCTPPDPTELQYRSIAGGMLVQSPDLLGLNEEQWRVVTKRSPTERELADLRLAWLICKHTKSNAITLVKDGMLLGNGAGQMSRVMSCRVATWLARENGHLDNAECRMKNAVPSSGPVAASDAFFPFVDGPRILMDAGVTAIIQPGGSKRDDETIAACDERRVAMIFTGTRHFRH